MSDTGNALSLKVQTYEAQLIYLSLALFHVKALFPEEAHTS